MGRSGGFPWAEPVNESRSGDSREGIGCALTTICEKKGQIPLLTSEEDSWRSHPTASHAIERRSNRAREAPSSRGRAPGYVCPALVSVRFRWCTGFNHLRPYQSLAQTPLGAATEPQGSRGLRRSATLGPNAPALCNVQTSRPRTSSILGGTNGLPPVDGCNST